MPTATTTTADAPASPVIGWTLSLIGAALAIAVAIQLSQIRLLPPVADPPPQVVAEPSPEPTDLEVPAPKTPEPPPPAPEAIVPPAPKVNKPGCLLQSIELRINQVRPGMNEAEALERIASWLKSQPEQPVYVRGYADASGSDLLNLRISLKRAVAVSKQLQKLGVQAEQITEQGLGSFVPLLGLSRKDAANRRVEVWMPTGECPETEGKD